MLFTANAAGRGVAAAVVLRIRPDGSQTFESAARFDVTLHRFVSLPIEFDAVTDQVYLLLFGTGLRGRSVRTGVTH